MLKEEAIKRLETIIENTANDGTYDYRIVANDWENYGKNRTYLKIVETRRNSKHHVEKQYGYIDNNTGEYVAGKNDLNRNFTFGGSKF